MDKNNGANTSLNMNKIVYDFLFLEPPEISSIAQPADVEISSLVPVEDQLPNENEATWFAEQRVVVFYLTIVDGGKDFFTVN